MREPIVEPVVRAAVCELDDVVCGGSVGVGAGQGLVDGLAAQPAVGLFGDDLPSDALVGVVVAALVAVAASLFGLALMVAAAGLIGDGWAGGLRARFLRTARHLYGLAGVRLVSTHMSAVWPVAATAARR